MMKNIIYTLLCLLVPLALYAGPQDKKKASASQPTKGTGKVYVFGFSHQLADTVVYITDIQEIDGVDLEQKTNFLPFRSDYSLQMKEYLEGKKGLMKQTTCVYFSKKQNKLAKLQAKLKRRYFNKPGMKISLILKQEFQFKNPLDNFIDNEEHK